MKKDGTKGLIFFAYQGPKEGKNFNHIDSIRAAINHYNQYQSGNKKYLAKSWEDYKKSTYIDYEILEIISNSAAFVCDLTFLNYNVLFELGFAIAKRIPTLIIIDGCNRSAVNIYENKFILKAIRALRYQNGDELSDLIDLSNFEADLLQKRLVKVDKISENPLGVFFIQGKSERQSFSEAKQLMQMHVNEYPEVHFEIDDSNEVDTQSLIYYYRNLIESKSIIIHLQNEEHEDAAMDNAKKSFFAGIACGLDKNVLIVAPAIFRPPLDYHDITDQYETDVECCSKLSDWIQSHVLSKIGEKSQYASMRKQVNNQAPLLELGIGCIVAEQEKNEDFLKYFLPTKSYTDALSMPQSMIIGSKGAGKSAIFKKLLDDFAKNQVNYIVELRPESHELIDNLELSILFDKAPSRRKFLVAAWKTAIYSKLLKTIYLHLADRIKNGGLDKAEAELVGYVDSNPSYVDLNLFSVISKIFNDKLSVQELNSSQVMEIIHARFLSHVIKLLRNYLTTKKYINVVILADNLHKIWGDNKYGLDIQSEMIAALMGIGESIKHDMSEKLDTKITQEIFLRSDIYDYIYKHCDGELDKFLIITREINWANIQEKLKELLELRFSHILNLNRYSPVEEIWEKYFYLSKKHPFDEIINYVEPRPRDLLYFVGKLFESAFDKNHNKVMHDDLEYAKAQYSRFIKTIWIDELGYEYKGIQAILDKLDSYGQFPIELRQLHKIILSNGCTVDQCNSLTKILIKLKYLQAKFSNGMAVQDLSLIEAKSDLAGKIFGFFRLAN